MARLAKPGEESEHRLGLGEVDAVLVEIFEPVALAV